MSPPHKQQVTPEYVLVTLYTDISRLCSALISDCQRIEALSDLVRAERILSLEKELQRIKYFFDQISVGVDPDKEAEALALKSIEKAEDALIELSSCFRRYLGEDQIRVFRLRLSSASSYVNRQLRQLSADDENLVQHLSDLSRDARDLVVLKKIASAFSLCSTARKGRWG